MKKLLMALALFASCNSFATYTFIVAQEPGGGTSLWANIVAMHLEKHLGEKIVIRHIPGARDIPGFNEFHNKLRFDDKTVMVSNGQNAESYLVEDVKYNFADYEPIAGMNLTSVNSYLAEFDPYDASKKLTFSYGPGHNIDAMSFVLLMCGNLPTMNAYLACYRERMIYIKGMDGSSRRLAFLRKELNVTRETTVAHIKHVQPLIANQTVKFWFSQGITDLKTGRVVADPNFPAMGSFEQAYIAKWGKKPSGSLFNAYMIAKQYRDVLQKALWMNKGNPNAAKVKSAVAAMLNDPDAVKALQADSGNYQWILGQDLTNAIANLNTQLTEQNLKDLVFWEKEAFDVNAQFKPLLLKQ
jgi:hypothetical protein|tara:strand:- start:3827 stop:4894 length:1068 start_codon:yes stop_codon:yes gene_type:complete